MDKELREKILTPAPDTELYRYVARKGQKCYTMAIAVQDVSDYYEYHEPAENGNSDGENNDV